MPATPGISEAAAIAVRAQLRSNLSLLNTRLNVDALTPNLTPVSTAQVNIGDGLKIPNYFFWVAIVGGDKDGGRELEPNFELLGGAGGTSFYNTYQATISVYLAPDTQNADDPVANEESRHVLLSRVSDWIRYDCFNNQNAIIISLTSQEYSSGLVFDQLKGAMIQGIYRGEALKGTGRSIWVPVMRHDFIASIA